MSLPVPWTRHVFSLSAVCAVVGCTVLLAAGAMHPAGEAQGESVAPAEHQAQFFTQLHNAAALSQFCAHIGRVKKSKVTPCPAGSSHPCCTTKQLEMAKMQGPKSQNFDWSDPGSWSGAKGAAAQHVAHKSADIQGMASPEAQTEWQNTAQAPQQQQQQQEPMQQQQQQQQQQPAYQQPVYEQQPQGYAPQQQAYGAPPQQQQGYPPQYAQQQPMQQEAYYPHLLPGQAGVPEQGAPPQYAPQPQMAGYPPQQYAQPQPAGYGAYVSPRQGPQMAPQQMAPQYAQPPQQGYAPAGYAPPMQQQQAQGR